MRVKLLYTKGDYERTTTPFNIEEIQGIESAYTGKVVRNNVVMRYDMMHALIGEFFEEETIEKYRNAIYNLVVGNNLDTQRVAAIITALYTDDKVFHKRYSELIYFDDECQETSVYAVLIRRVLSCIGNYTEVFGDLLRTYHLRPIATSHLYTYVSFNDVDMELVVPRGYREEVLSVAKVWRGNIRRQ